MPPIPSPSPKGATVGTAAYVILASCGHSSNCKPTHLNKTDKIIIAAVGGSYAGICLIIWAIRIITQCSNKIRAKKQDGKRSVKEVEEARRRKAEADEKREREVEEEAAAYGEEAKDKSGFRADLAKDRYGENKWKEIGGGEMKW